MFAVIENGSRQHRVQQGDTLTIDYQADAKKGDTVTFDRVLLANGGGASAIGRPTIEGAVVEAAVVIALDKGPKLEIQKFRRRKDSKRHTGHRQKHTTVRITAINVPGLEVVLAAHVHHDDSLVAPVLGEPASRDQELWVGEAVLRLGFLMKAARQRRREQQRGSGP